MGSRVLYPVGIMLQTATKHTESGAGDGAGDGARHPGDPYLQGVHQHHINNTYMQ